MLFGDIGDGFRDGRAVGTEHCVHLFLRDQLLVDAYGRLSIRGIVVDHELNWTSKDTALFVDVLLAEQVALTDIAALYGIPPSDRDRGPELDWLLGQARASRPDNGRRGKRDKGGPSTVAPHGSSPVSRRPVCLSVDPVEGMSLLQGSDGSGWWGTLYRALIACQG